MRLLRFFLICSMFFNCLAADVSVGELAALCRDTIAVPVSTFSVLLGCNLPLELVTRLIEQRCPSAAKAGSNHEQKQKQRQPVSDVFSLMPERSITGAGSLCSMATEGSVSVVLARVDPLQSGYHHFDRWRPTGAACLILVWLVIVSLMNLPGDAVSCRLHNSSIRSPSENWRAFSIL